MADIQYDIHVVAMLANDLLKLNNAINTCLINLNIIIYHVFSLIIY